MAKAGLPEASAAIAIVTTRQTIGFGMEVIALLGADSGAPRNLLLLNFAITAASELFYRGGFAKGGSICRSYQRAPGLAT